MELVILAPEMNHFVGEHLFALAHLFGRRGIYTSWFMMNPRFLHEYYQMCLGGHHQQAIAISQRLTKWVIKAVKPLKQKGYTSPALDKAFAEMGGWLPGNRRTRKPNRPLTDEDFAELKRAIAETVPEFLEYKP